MNEQSAAIIRACRGPVLLITVGSLFALDHFTPYRFTQTWPLLLIVLGVMRLLGGPRRFRDRPPGAPPQ